MIIHIHVDSFAVLQCIPARFTAALSFGKPLPRFFAPLQKTCTQKAQPDSHAFQYVYSSADTMNSIYHRPNPLLQCRQIIRPWAFIKHLVRQISRQFPRRKQGIPCVFAQYALPHIQFAVSSFPTILDIISLPIQSTCNFADALIHFSSTLPHPAIYVNRNSPPVFYLPLFYSISKSKFPCYNMFRKQ